MIYDDNNNKNYCNLCFLLVEKLKKDVSKEFKNKTINDLLVFDDVFEDSRFIRNIKLLYKKDFIDDNFIEDNLKLAIFNQARKDYNYLVLNNSSKIKTAEKIKNPEYLSYALKNGYFSIEEMKKIPFEKNLDYFIDFYSIYGLISVCREELLY
jgi:hypothetical protein